MELTAAFRTALILELTSCAVMVGVIWIVQLILYPSFADIKQQQFRRFHSRHSFMISFIVGPTMIVELAAASFLFYQKPTSRFWLFNLVGVFFIWACTASLSIPGHRELEKNYEIKKVSRLIATNWPRTALWTVRFIFLVWALITI